MMPIAKVWVVQAEENTSEPEEDSHRVLGAFTALDEAQQAVMRLGPGIRQDGELEYGMYPYAQFPDYRLWKYTIIPLELGEMR